MEEKNVHSKRKIKKREDVPEGKVPKNIGIPTTIKGLESIIQITEDKTSDTASISFDGSQYLVRFPSKIARAINIKEKDKIKFTVILYSTKESKKEEILIEYIRAE